MKLSLIVSFSFLIIITITSCGKKRTCECYDDTSLKEEFTIRNNDIQKAIEECASNSVEGQYSCNLVVFE